MLKVNQISFRYSEKDSVLKELSFAIDRGNHLSIIGGSGSGKSTLLKLIYGLLEPTSGEIFWNGEKVMGPNYRLIAGEDDMKLVSQELDLQAFTTVKANVVRHVYKDSREGEEAMAMELLDIVGLKDVADRKVEQLSIGQRQRVALGHCYCERTCTIIT